jgi:hypothetical protein
MIGPIRSLYEPNLTVRGLDRSIMFYCGVLGLPPARAIPEPNLAIFLGTDVRQGDARAMVFRHGATLHAPSHCVRRDATARV